MRDRIIVRDLPLECQIGVSGQERENPQRIFVNLQLYLDLRPAAATDHVASTVNYSEVCDAVVRLAGSREFRLIETLAEEIAATLLAAFPLLDTVVVEVRKPLALARRGVSHTSVEIQRSR